MRLPSAIFAPIVLLAGCNPMNSGEKIETGTLPVFPANERDELIEILNVRADGAISRNDFLKNSERLSGIVSPEHWTPNKLRCGKLIKHSHGDAKIVTVSFKSFSGNPAIVSAFYEVDSDKVLCFDVLRPKS